MRWPAGSAPGLGRPLRCARAPGEAIDLPDLVALAGIIQATAEEW